MKYSTVLIAAIAAVVIPNSIDQAWAQDSYNFRNQIQGTTGLLALDTGFNRNSSISATTGGSTFSALSGVYDTQSIPNNLPFLVSGTNQNAFVLSAAQDPGQGGGRGLAVAGLNYFFTLTTPDGRQFDQNGQRVPSRTVNVDYIIDLRGGYADSVFGSFNVRGFGQRGSNEYIYRDIKTICEPGDCGGTGKSSVTLGQVGLEIFPNFQYTVELSSSVLFDCPNFCNRPSGLGISSAVASAFVDPYFYLDSNVPGFENYTLQFSPGIGNRPLVVAAVPEPTTWAMMIIGFGAAGSMLRRSKAVIA
jgi:PEP-CTERM motif